MSLCKEILLNGVPAYPKLKIHPHYYADKFVACDWVVYSMFWYAQCVFTKHGEDNAMAHYECVSDIVNATSVYVWKTYEKRNYQKDLEKITWVQTCKKEGDSFEVHLYKTELGHYHGFCAMHCTQFNKDNPVSFTIGDGTKIKMIY